jgi:hypothetical protein
MRQLILWNLLCATPAALWLALSRRYSRALCVLGLTIPLTFLWPLPPVPMIAALVIALTLRR